MFKFFSNTILAYLENDLNNFSKNNNYHIINMLYSTVVVEGEVVHNVLVHYSIPTE